MIFLKVYRTEELDKKVTFSGKSKDCIFASSAPNALKIVTNEKYCPRLQHDIHQPIRTSTPWLKLAEDSKLSRIMVFDG